MESLMSDFNDKLALGRRKLEKIGKTRKVRLHTLQSIVLVIFLSFWQKNNLKNSLKFIENCSRF